MATKDELVEIIKKAKHYAQPYETNLPPDFIVTACNAGLELAAMVGDDWVRCSERLPEKRHSLYEITYTWEEGGTRYVAASEFYKGVWPYCPDATVIAWRELPEPYEGEV